MKRSIDDFTPQEKQIIYELFLEGFPVQYIAELTNLTYYEVLYCLQDRLKNLNVNSIIHGAFVDEEQVLVMADTHIGSKYENFDYIKEAQKFALDNKIHTIFHAGDIIQSTCRNVLEEYRNEEDQVEHLVQDFPYDPSIRYIMIFGNHDWHTFANNKKCMDIFSSRKDFYLLGTEFGFINWRGSTICLFHPVKRYPLEKPRVKKTVMTFRGHSHELQYGGSGTTYCSTLSDDPASKDTVKPGFLVSTNDNDYLSVDSYFFKDSLHYGGKIQHKKLYK